MGAATTGCRLVALCALVPFVCGDDATTCAEATTPWAPTGCGIKDLQGIVVDGTKYLVTRTCGAEAACAAREVFRTRDGCSRWTVEWYATPLPAALGLVPSCVSAAEAVLRPDGRVAAASFYGVETRARRGYSRDR